MRASAVRASDNSLEISEIIIKVIISNVSALQFWALFSVFI